MNTEQQLGVTGAITKLQSAYMEYMVALKSVLDLGQENLPSLISALNNKYASPIAKALGLMMYATEAEAAIPSLVEWVVVQSPMYPEVLEALVRAREKALPYVLDKLRGSVECNDDEAVRNLLDVGVRLTDSAITKIVDHIIAMLGNQNPDIREAAAEAIGALGLPRGFLATKILEQLAQNDPDPSVRTAAIAALSRLVPPH